ncbi:MAG TPA: hypothetical protein VK390_05185 [Propionibacteriaceae bacterium]|nr:hypothetical protein [Propionibacteriaceae bacterium]
MSAEDRRALTEMLVDKIIIERHPSKIDKDGGRHSLIRAIPYQDPRQEAEAAQGGAGDQNPWRGARGPTESPDRPDSWCTSSPLREPIWAQ